MLTGRHPSSRVEIWILGLLLLLGIPGDATSGGGPFGACCTPDSGCTETTPVACGDLGGIYQGDNTVCSQLSCPVEMPAAGREGLVLLGVLLLALGSLTLWRRYSAESRSP